MGMRLLQQAIEKLQQQFGQLDFKRQHIMVEDRIDTLYQWPGPEDESVMITIHKSTGKQEVFHRHDYFYFNYTYKGQYESLSQKYDHKITIRERELYAGQPFAGHALGVLNNSETVVIGVLIKQETFFRSFLPLLSSNSDLFQFFLDPTTNHYSQEFIHLKVENDCNVRRLLEMMLIEYANKKPDTQGLLKPLTLAFLLEIARQYTGTRAAAQPQKLSEQIVRYMAEHIDTVTLKMVADQFSYHPNYVSTLMRRELGKSFSEILLEQRMERAKILLKGTNLTVEEISLMLGYSNSSNFHKAFREYYRCSPRAFGEK